jgi:hypothetical protein
MEIKHIAQALVKAQREFGPALKTKTNPHLKSRYADLEACIEAVIDALHNNGVALMQHTHDCDNGVIIETVFLHESGETLSTGRLHVPAIKADPQGYGSALTYARRYSLMAACGIAPEDDDGQFASKKTTVQVPDGYAVYEADTLDLMRDAALNGSQALAKAFADLPKSAHKALFWQTKGAELKKAAQIADKAADNQGASE